MLFRQCSKTTSVAMPSSSWLLWQHFLICNNRTLTLSPAKQKILVVSHFKCPPPAAFCLWTLWFVVRRAHLEPGWPAPSPASKLVADEIFMTVWLETRSIWSAAVPLMLPPLLHSTSAFPHSGGSNHGETEGRRPHPSLIFTNHRHGFF